MVGLSLISSVPSGLFFLEKGGVFLLLLSFSDSIPY